MDIRRAGGSTRRISWILGPLVGILLVWASPAWASPSYLASSPEPEERMDEAPASVWIDFDEPLDEASYIEVSDECGRRVDAGNTQVTANRMEVGIKKKPSGHYIVFYVARGVGGVTGQERGQFHFVVRTGPRCGPSTGPGHEGHGDSGGGEHSGAGHGGPGGHAGHAGGSGGGDPQHAGHVGMEQPRHSGHGGGAYSGKHGGRGKHAGHADEGPAADEGDATEEGTTLAADETELPADGGAVLLGLGLAIVLGALGGWYLRISVP